MKRYLLIALLFAAGQAAAQTFTLSSADLGGQFTNNFMAANMGCSGTNTSPELHWTNPPTGTKSFAVTMYDPDAPTGSGFWHWVVVDIPATASQIKCGTIPAGSLSTLSDMGTPGYQGPCPPEGDAPHRYVITIYALNTAKLGTSENSTAALSGFLLNKAAIAKASIIVYSKR